MQKKILYTVKIFLLSLSLEDVSQTHISQAELKCIFALSENTNLHLLVIKKLIFLCYVKQIITVFFTNDNDLSCKLRNSQKNVYYIQHISLNSIDRFIYSFMYSKNYIKSKILPSYIFLNGFLHVFITYCNFIKLGLKLYTEHKAIWLHYNT